TGSQGTRKTAAASHLREAAEKTTMNAVEGRRSGQLASWPKRSGFSLQLTIDFSDERAIILPPRMPAGQEERAPGQKNPAEHARPTEEIARGSQPRPWRVDPVLSEEVRHVAQDRAPELHADEEHDLRANQIAARAIHVPGREQVRVISDAF